MLDKLTKKELLDVVKEYDDYIQSANDDNLYTSGWRPVCIDEFYNNEYQLILEDRKGNNND